MASKRKRSRSKPEITFDLACARVESILQGTTREEILSGIARPKSFGASLLQLRENMRANQFTVGSSEVSLQRIIRRLDRKTQEDGFHVLHDWDGKADKLNEETIPVDVLNFMMDRRVAESSERTVLAILLDYYFFYVVALLSMRIWDQGHVEDNLDRVTRLLDALQGPGGSGQKFADNAETLIIVATSHFEPDENAYERLLEKVRTWKRPHCTNMALAHAAILSSHLRFGFETNYGRDIIQMRKDNIPDYPWLCFALLTLMGDYTRMHDEGTVGTERERVVESILNGLSPDPRAFVGAPSASLATYEDELKRFGQLFRKHEQELLEEFERHRPSEVAYSPISFFFNFSHNLLKAIVIDALLRGEAWSLSLNELLTGVPGGDPLDESRKTLAKTLMAYARSSPDTIAGRRVPVIVYDPRKGLRAFRDAIGKLTK